MIYDFITPSMEFYKTPYKNQNHHVEFTEKRTHFRELKMAGNTRRNECCMFVYGALTPTG